MNRQEAMKCGEMFYDSSTCARCFTELRYTSNGVCVECASQRRQGEGRVTRNEARRGREKAKAAGLTTYKGMQCHKCGTHEHYTANAGCVKCNADKRKAPGAQSRKVTSDARNQALAIGSKQYEGAPCKKCGNTARYTVNSGCVACISSKAVQHKQAQRAKYHSTDCLVIWVNEPPAPSVAHLYKLIPLLASNPDGGNWSLRYTDAHHLVPSGMRLFTGRDVLERPQVMQMLGADYTLRGARGGHYDIVPHITAVMTQAIRLNNLERNK